MFRFARASQIVIVHITLTWRDDAYEVMMGSWALKFRGLAVLLDLCNTIPAGRFLKVHLSRHAVSPEVQAVSWKGHMECDFTNQRAGACSLISTQKDSALAV